MARVFATNLRLKSAGRLFTLSDLRVIRHRPGRTASVGGAIVLLSAVLAASTPSFLTLDNLLDVGRQSSLLGLMAIGVTVVLISGQIDLSIASTFTLAGVVAAMLILNGADVGWAVLAGLAVGVSAGLVNGIISAYFKLPSFIVTLGTLQIMFGIALLLTDAQNRALYALEGGGIGVFFYAGRGSPAGIPMQLIIVLAVAMVVALVLRRTVFGLHLFAVGGSPRAAELAGLRNSRIRIGAFVISGVFAAAAGLLALGFIGSVSPIGARGMEFDVFAAAVIGGASLYGGRGTALGALLGALLIGVLRNGLVLLGVSTFWQMIVIGLVTIGAVAQNRLLVRNRPDELTA